MMGREDRQIVQGREMGRSPSAWRGRREIEEPLDGWVGDLFTLAFIVAVVAVVAIAVSYLP